MGTGILSVICKHSENLVGAYVLANYIHIQMTSYLKYLKVGRKCYLCATLDPQPGGSLQF